MTDPEGSKSKRLANAPKNRGVTPEGLARAEELLSETLNPRRAARQLSGELNIALRTAKRYIGEVRKVWAAEAEHDNRTIDRDSIRNSTLSIYEEARGEGDRRSALSALKLLVDLDGLAAPQQHEVTPKMPPAPPGDKDGDDAAESRLMLVAGGRDE